MGIYTTQQCLQSLVESSSHKYSSFVSNPKYKPITLKGLLYHTARVNIIFVYKNKSESPNKQQLCNIEWIKNNWSDICIKVNEKLEKFAGTDNPIKLRYRFRNPSLYVFDNGNLGIMMYDHNKAASGTIVLLKPSIIVVDSKEYLND